MTGFGYTVPFALLGFGWGKMESRLNRKWVLGLLMFAAAAQTGLQGATTSFALLAACRVLNGVISSGFNSLSFSLLAEYIPASRRTTANTILQSGNYMAWGMSSLSVLLIRSLGWRATFTIQAAVTAIVGLMTITLVKEPLRNMGKKMAENKKDNEKAAVVMDEVDPNYTKEELEEMKDKPYKYLLTNPVNKWCMLGSFLRNIGGSALTFFLPVFFLKNFPLYKAQYASANALILSCFGLASAILGGYIGDKYAKKNKMTNAFVCMSGALLGLPLYAMATLQTSNFWLSMGCHATVTLFAAAMSGSAITMM